MYVCPYIREDYDTKVRLIDEYNELPSQIPLCWCDKLGGKIWSHGQCSDTCVVDDISEKNGCSNYTQRSRQTKRERDLRYKRKLRQKAKLYHGAYYYDEKYAHGKGFISLERGYYKRFYRDKHKNGRYRYYKFYSNRVVRRYKGGIANGGAYKKCFDYWWTVD